MDTATYVYLVGQPRDELIVAILNVSCDCVFPTFREVLPSVFLVWIGFLFVIIPIMVPWCPVNKLRKRSGGVDTINNNKKTLEMQVDNRAGRRL